MYRARGEGEGIVNGQYTNTGQSSSTEPVQRRLRNSILDSSTASLYHDPMGLKTTAFERADALGWGVPELARRSGLSEATLYKLRDGTRAPGQKAIEGLLQAFPNLGYRDLFVRADRIDVRHRSIDVSSEDAAA